MCLCDKFGNHFIIMLFKYPSKDCVTLHAYSISMCYYISSYYSKLNIIVDLKLSIYFSCCMPLFIFNSVHMDWCNLNILQKLCFCCWLFSDKKLWDDKEFAEWYSEINILNCLRVFTLLYLSVHFQMVPRETLNI